MKARSSRKPLLVNRLVWPVLLAALIISTVVVTNLLAQNPQAQGAQATPVTPNWDLAARWTPARIG